MLYDMFSNIGNFLSQPFINMAHSMDGIPLLFAFILGLVGALAPCQFTANLGVITIYGNKSLQRQMAWAEVLLFLAGKILVFTGLGFMVWMVGQEFQRSLTVYFPWIRRVVGPLLIIVGLYMAGFFNMRWTLKIGEIPKRYIKEGKLGAFLMGISFSLGFCPTMFVLFFVTLMPIVLSTSYGMVLPSVFAIGTSIPLLIAVFLLWYFGLSGTFMKKGRKIGLVIQKTAGWLMITLGVIDTLTYWSLY